MFFTFEISRPFQRRINIYRCPGVTTFRVCWLWFALSLHPIRYDELVDMISRGIVRWEKR